MLDPEKIEYIFVMKYESINNILRLFMTVMIQFFFIKIEENVSCLKKCVTCSAARYKSEVATKVFRMKSFTGFSTSTIIVILPLTEGSTNTIIITKDI